VHTLIKPYFGDSILLLLDLVPSIKNSMIYLSLFIILTYYEKIALYKLSPLNVLLMKKAPELLKMSATKLSPRKSSPAQIIGDSRP
jgi:hypothetical protein